MFERETDAGGRLAETVKTSKEHDNAEYELVFQTRPLFRRPICASTDEANCEAGRYPLFDA
jgi:5-hydroxyisourate hydrolase-like protein (transthyretin family)